VECRRRDNAGARSGAHTAVAQNASDLLVASDADKIEHCLVDVVATALAIDQTPTLADTLRVLWSFSDLPIAGRQKQIPATLVSARRLWIFAAR
jgi:hypothetical protein